MDYVKLVSEKEGELSSLFSRMDSDLNLYHLEAYEMKGYNGRKVDRVDNVTLNDPRVFADRVISILGSAEPQYEVEGESGEKASDKKTSEIETWIKDALLGANKLLERKMILPLHPYLSFQVCLRGWAGARVLVLQDETFDILPLDMRYVTYEIGSNGLLWVAPKTTRSKALIEAEYGITVSGKTGEVIDFWNENVNAILIDKEVVKEEGHSLGAPPFVLAPVSMSPLLGEDGRKDFGESVFSGNRGLYREKNKLASILQTTNVMAFRAPMQFKSESGDKMPDQPPYGEGVVAPVKIGEGFESMPWREIAQSAPFFFSIIDAALQRGSMAHVEYGSLEFPMSAIGIAKLTEMREQIFAPRKWTLEKIYEGICEMLLAQAKKEGKVKVRLTTVSPEQNIANYSVAGAARPFLDTDTIRRDILLLEDPTAVANKVLIDMAEAEVPAIRLYGYAKAFIEQGEDMKARLIAKQLGMTLEQLMGKEKMPEERPTGAEAETGVTMPQTQSAKAQILSQEMRQKGLLPE